MIVTDNINIDTYYYLNINGLRQIYREQKEGSDGIYLIFKNRIRAIEFAEYVDSKFNSLCTEMDLIAHDTPSKYPSSLYQSYLDTTHDEPKKDLIGFQHICRGYVIKYFPEVKSKIFMVELLKIFNEFAPQGTTPSSINLSEKGMIPNILAN